MKQTFSQIKSMRLLMPWVRLAIAAYAEEVPDRTGQHYGKGQGLHVLANGKEIAKSAKIDRVTGPL